MKSIIIARVSTEEQRDANNSLPAQTHRMKDYCQRKNLPIMKEFSFDESGYKKKRDEFDEILDYVIGQTECVAVCFDKVDRLSRDIFDKRVSVIYEMALIDKIQLHFVSDGQVINSQISAVQKFQFSISLGLAKYYSDAISDNVKRGNEEKLRRGELPGKAHFGYKNVVENDKNIIVVDEFTSRITLKQFELYAAGAQSLELMCKKLKEEHGINWKKGRLHQVLTDRFYIGEMVRKDKVYPHYYPQFIPRALFDQVQQVLAGHNKQPHKYAGKPYLYRGILSCGHCGLSITPEMHKGHVYYHCTQYRGKHGAEWVTEADLTEQIGSVFSRLKVPEHVFQEILETLKNTHQSKTDFRAQEHQKLTQEHELYAKRLEQLYMDRLDRRITDTDYDKFYQSFRSKVAEIDTRLSMLQDAEDNYYITAQYLVELTQRAFELFKSSEVDERRQLIKLVLSNVTLDGKLVRYEAQKPFDTILNYADRHLWWPLRDSNP